MDFILSLYVIRFFLTEIQIENHMIMYLTFALLSLECTYIKFILIGTFFFTFLVLLSIQQMAPLEGAEVKIRGKN